MEATELREIQKRVKFDAPSMAVSLGLDYEQYRRYLYGTAAIPQSVADLAVQFEIIQKEQDEKRDRDFCAYLDRHYPNGIISEVIDADE